MSILADISDAMAYSVIEQSFETASGPRVYFWRVRRFSPAEALAALGPAVLLAAAPPPGPTGELSDDPEVAAALAADPGPSADMMQAAADNATRSALVAIAAVDAVSADGITWEPIALVATRDEEDKEAGRLFVGTLTSGMLVEITHAALAGPRGAQERLRSFRPGGAGAAGPNLQAVRDPAEQAGGRR